MPCNCQTPPPTTPCRDTSTDIPSWITCADKQASSSACRKFNTIPGTGECVSYETVESVYSTDGTYLDVLLFAAPLGSDNAAVGFAITETCGCGPALYTSKPEDIVRTDNEGEVRYYARKEFRNILSPGYLALTTVVNGAKCNCQDFLFGGKCGKSPTCFSCFRL